MGIRIQHFTVPVGTVFPLSAAQGEDREFRPVFTVDGVPITYSLVDDYYLRIVNPASGLPVLETRNIPGSPFVLKFRVYAADIAGTPAMECGADIIWIDGDGIKTQLLAYSPYDILAGAP